LRFIQNRVLIKEGTMMTDQNQFILIRCQDCSQGFCAVHCAEGTLAFMHGDLLIDTQKCGNCPQKAAEIPRCVAECKHSGEKFLIDQVPVEDKRTQAVNAMSLL
jgi:Fe-S-cluster-containing hydrogenase component 2